MTSQSNEDGGVGSDQFYEGTYIEDFDVQVGSNPRRTLSSVTQNVWGVNTIIFIASATSETFTVYPGADSGFTGTKLNLVEMIHLSVDGVSALEILDTDGDGIDDTDDIDDDNDGLLDVNDNCPLTTNVDQLDNDGDGVGDICDNDDDNDGILDTEDNCSILPNQLSSLGTVAGENGEGSAANQLNGPNGIVLDASGFIYVADHENNRIQKWAPGATEGFTVAGGNGEGSAANQLNGPNGIALDASGNLYVADEQNHRVQKWAPGSTEGVTVAGGNGKGSAANQLNEPYGVL